MVKTTLVLGFRSDGKTKLNVTEYPNLKLAKRGIAGQEWALYKGYSLNQTLNKLKTLNWKEEDIVRKSRFRLVKK